MTRPRSCSIAVADPVNGRRDGDRIADDDQGLIPDTQRREPVGSREGFCPVTVTDDLDDLRGPTRGRHRLPSNLDPHGDTHHDLTDTWARRRLTITVLTTAATEDELHTWIDRDTLLTAWPTLYLDTHTRHTLEGLPLRR